MDTHAAHDPRMKKVRKAVMGTQVVQRADFTYWREKARAQAKISPVDWAELSLNERGKLTAFVRIENMVEGLRRYHDELTRRS